MWREALLAQKVLQNQTKGYRHHPQLDRFKEAPDPLGALASYLEGVLEEATRRGYCFNAAKITTVRSQEKLLATDGQLRHEWAHLMAKLCQRSPPLYEGLQSVVIPEPHPLFQVTAGPVARWERHGLEANGKIPLADP